MQIIFPSRRSATECDIRARTKILPCNLTQLYFKNKISFTVLQISAGQEIVQISRYVHHLLKDGLVSCQTIDPCTTT